MKFAFLILSALTVSCQALAAESPAYVGLPYDNETLQSALKAQTKEDQIVCKNVFFVRIERSMKVVLGGLCTIKSAPAKMACLNGDSGKISIADRSYPELTAESEIRMLMHDGCDL